VQLMHGVNPHAAAPAPDVLRGSGTAASETVVAVGVQVQCPAAQSPARTDSSSAALLSEVVHGSTPVLDG
jgi:hypothetical protein